MTDEEILRKLEDCTREAPRLQLETLQTILEHNGGVSYLRPYLQNALIDDKTFRRFVPISSYDDYAPLINRMADGADDHPSLLSVDPLICFFYSSGTSSMKPKMIPQFNSTHSRAASFLAHQGSSALLRRLFPPGPSVNKVLWFLYAGNVTVTKGGFKVMAASAYPLHSNSSSPSPMLSMCVSPREVILGSDLQQQMYCHLLCGLRNPNSVDGIRAPYAAGLVRAFRLLESKWEELCNDLENGSVSSMITDVSMRDAVAELLGGPQPELSKTIRTAPEGRQFGGILGKLWPNLRYVTCVSTGTMEQYYPLIKYYAGEIPVLGGDYFASECCIAINLDRTQPPEQTRYVLLPTAAYFEFLPFDLAGNHGAAEETVDISGVEIGKMYEVVVTTYRGLYRFRLGDIVRVLGFHNLSPELEYVMRAPKAAGEVFTERDLMSAMERLQVMLRDEAMVEVTEFTSYSDMESKPNRVTIFVEVMDGCFFLQNDKVEESTLVLRKCCSSVEECLGGLYNVQRRRGDLGPLVLSIVKPGSFDRLIQVAMENGASASQYKPPKIIRNSEIVNLMEASVIMTVHSTAYPEG
ncbi:PREDICTED: probable indole-3-acetic acid-amido synthetase GH3.6 [Nelumbo nucifera]|uniref:Indole-3-acetic acid-amido synthetase GH3.6 n=2 Tax=Nelumbo nucifera TaxID=4432 RepID=A0A822YH50_NELNU|nr:PREDICTED: probable indole-3-acetic acid-amido synthetase GH3.6 [Nelumbo nucifera]DAD33514.1 TPA_asm: hypothetical protein HUJ06_012365 [Nelumbo nucifera]